MSQGIDPAFGIEEPLFPPAEQLNLFADTDEYVFELVDWYRPGKEDYQRWLWLGQQQGHYVTHAKGPKPSNVSFLWLCECGALGEDDKANNVDHIRQEGVVDDGRMWVVKVPITGRKPGQDYDSYIAIPTDSGTQYVPEAKLITQRPNPVEWRS